MSGWDAIGVLVACVICVVLSFVGGHTIGTDRATKVEQQKAIEAKVGKWEIDSQTGERKFVYGCWEEKK